MIAAVAQIAKLGGFELNSGVLAQGLFTGMTYGLLAAGLVLVYRSSRFINFAHSFIGLFGAAIVSLAVTQYGIPYWIALAFGLLVAAGVGAATEIVVVRPLATAPKVLSMVATLGLSSFLIFTALAMNPDGLSGLAFPQPSGMPTGSIGALRVTKSLAAQGILSPLVLIGLGLFLAKSKTGLAIRGAASNPDAAATSGISPRFMAVLSWAIAGAIAAFAAVLILPSRGVVTPESLGPELLLRGLAAAAIARFSHYGVAVATAIGIGVVEQVFATNPDAKGWIEVLILAAVICSLLFDRRGGRQALEPWNELGTATPLAATLRRLPIVRWCVGAGIVVALAAAIFVPVIANGSQALDLTIVIGLGIVGISVSLVTGLGGQLSLAQFGFGAIAAAVSVRVARETTLPVGILVGALVAGVVSMLVAIPALRVRGPQLGVATLSFSLVTSAFLLNKKFLLGDEARPGRPKRVIGGISLSESRGYYWVALAVLIAVLASVHRLRQSSFARTVVAVRDNEDGARAMSLSATRVKLQLAMIGGFIAGIGGAIYGHGFTTLSAANFPVSSSIDAITVAVIGGLNSLIGPVLGALYLKGLPSLLHFNSEALAGLSGAWLILLVYQHGGFVGLLTPLRDRLAASLDRGGGSGVGEVGEVGGVGGVGFVGGGESGAQPLSRSTSPDLNDLDFPDRRTEVGQPLLQVQGVSRRFGGLTALDDVTFSVNAGEMVGLIGPNGAGKTTLFETISGFTLASGGIVMFRGADVSRLSPQARASQGLARSFQSALLFPTLTVVQTVMVALERTMPSSLVEAAVTKRPDRRRHQVASTLLSQFGLEHLAEVRISTLPTGQRRLVELVCAVALKPRLMLLDEPSAGIAQAETEELGRTLQLIHHRTGVAMIIIEHDLALLASICDRLIGLEVGRIIADGTPGEVQANPAVIASYVGDNDIAVNRSAGA